MNLSSARESRQESAHARSAALVPGKRDAAMRALGALERTLNDTYAHLSADCGFPLAGFPNIARWVDRIAGIIGPGHPVVPYGPEARPS